MFQGGEMSQNVPERNVPGQMSQSSNVCGRNAKAARFSGAKWTIYSVGRNIGCRNVLGSVIGHVSDTALVCHRSGLPLIKQQQVYGRAFTPPPQTA